MNGPERPDLRLVLDTNLLVSAFLFPRSPPGACLDFAQDNAIILASDDTLTELGEVLFRRKFNKRASIERRAASF